MRMRHIVICGLPELYNTYRHYLIRGTIFEKKKIIEHKIHVLIFSITFVWNISRPKNIRARYDQVYICVLMKYPLFLSDFNETSFLGRFSKNNQM